MPNWCYNRVTAYGDEDKLKEIEKIFESKTPFNDIFPMPDFKTIPNEKGELPKLEQMKNPDGSILWETCLLYTSPSPRDLSTSRMPSSA